MCVDNLKQYQFITKDKKVTMKLEFHQDSINDLKITSKSEDDNEIEFIFDLETTKQLNKKITKFIKTQNKLIDSENKKELQKTCEHKNTGAIFPYGWLGCFDCGKLL